MCDHFGTKSIELESYERDTDYSWGWQYTRFCMRCGCIYFAQAGSGLGCRKESEIKPPDCFGLYDSNSRCMKCSVKRLCEIYEKKYQEHQRSALSAAQSQQT